MIFPLKWQIFSIFRGFPHDFPMIFPYPIVYRGFSSKSKHPGLFGNLNLRFVGHAPEALDRVIIEGDATWKWDTNI